MLNPPGAQWGSKPKPKAMPKHDCTARQCCAVAGIGCLYPPCEFKVRGLKSRCQCIRYWLESLTTICVACRRHVCLRIECSRVIEVEHEGRRVRRRFCIPCVDAGKVPRGREPKVLQDVDTSSSMALQIDKEDPVRRSPAIDRQLSRWTRPVLQKAIDAAWQEVQRALQSESPPAPVLSIRQRLQAQHALSGNLARYGLASAAAAVGSSGRWGSIIARAGHDGWGLGRAATEGVTALCLAHGVVLPWLPIVAVTAPGGSMASRRTSRRAPRAAAAPAPASTAPVKRVDPLAHLQSQVAVPQPPVAPVVSPLPQNGAPPSPQNGVHLDETIERMQRSTDPLQKPTPGAAGSIRGAVTAADGGLPVAVATTAPAGPPVATPVAPEAVGTGALFREVYTNVKRGGRAQLGPCTAFVAPSNRSGKTRYLDAIQLALRGRHPIGSSVDALLSLSDGETLIAGLRDASGEPVAVYQIDKDGKPAHQRGGVLAGLTDDQIAQILPLTSMEDLVRFGTPLAREEFLRRFGGAGVNVDPPAGLDERQIAQWHQALVAVGAEVATPGGYLRTAMDPIDALTELPGYFRRQKLALGKQATALKDETDRRRQAIMESAGMLVTAEAVEEARKLLSQAETFDRLVDQRRLLAEKQAEYARVYEEATRVLAQPVPPAFISSVEADAESVALTHAEKAIEEAEREVQLATGQVGAMTLAVEARRLLVQTAGAGQGHVCIFCTERPTRDMKALLASAEAQLAEAQRVFDAARTARQQAHGNLGGLQEKIRFERAKRQQAHDARVRENARLTDQLIALNHQIQELTQTLSAVGAVEDPKVPVMEARLRYENLHRAQMDLHACDTNSARVRQLETEQGIIKTLEKAAEQTLTQASLRVASSAVTAVQSYLPEGFLVRLVLVDENGKRTYRWDVTGTDGQPHRKGAMSGAELGALKIALACAWAENLPVRIVCLDDADLAGFSAAGVRAFLDKMRECVTSGKLTQCFAAWSRPEEIPGGWSVVRVDG